MKNLLLYPVLLLLLSCGVKNASNEVVKAEIATPQKTQQTTNKPAPRTANTVRPRQAPKPASNGNYKPKNEGWFVDLEKAFAESQKTGKPIMANFTGSDWCGWCKRLDKSVFHQPAFKTWADENLVLIELDFPRRFRLPENIAAQNRSLAQSLGVRGYPTVWVFDLAKDGSGRFEIRALGKTGYTKTFKEFKSTVDGFLAQRQSS